jgi:hypothetical protein
MDPKDYITLSDGITVGDEDTITLSNYPWSNTGGYTVNNASISASSYPYTITGSNTAPYTLGAGTGIASPWYSNSMSPKIQLNGEGADIEINGESMIGMLKKIEERLNILTPNDKLEEEWEELRALGNKYRELEQHIKDKQATWDKLKAMPPPVSE